MFGRRKREEAEAAEAAREAERRALFAKLAERPEHICPFLGLESDRTGHVEGVSDDHRCFAFGDPAPISAEQQTQVCQERGYGNCPRYLRGVLVIPTEELEALRRRPAAAAAAPVPLAPVPKSERRRRGPVLVVAALLVLVGAGAAGAFLLLGDRGGVAVEPSPSQPLSAEPAVSQTPAVTSSGAPTEQPSATVPVSPTPEPTPVAGDEFAFYEVSVGPAAYTLYEFDDGGVFDTRTVGFDQFSFAQVDPQEGVDGEVYWVTLDGDLAGLAYRAPDSGDFRIRAVFLNGEGERRSVYLDQDELSQIPESTPAP